MFTFGYKLQLVKESDLKEYDLFEKSVYAIHQQTNDFVQWLSNGFTLDENTVHQLAVDIEGLHTFIDVYFENKYSSPSSTMMMFNKIDVIRKTAGRMIDVIMEVRKIETIRSKANEEVTESEDFQITYKRAIDSAMRQMRSLTNTMIDSLKGIHVVIESDLIRLILGVDIMKEHKKRCKRLPKDKELMTDFFVHFKAITKEDRKFLEKENGKNE